MADTQVIISAVDRTGAAFASVRGGLNRMGSALTSVRAQLGAIIGTAGMTALIKQSFAAGDATAKMADRLGIANEKLGGIKHALDLAGVSESTFATATRTMANNLADAARGTGEAAVALNALGISAQKLLALPMDQQINVILDGLSKMENVTLRNAYASDIFGGRASEMLNLISDGAAGIRKATEDAQAWNLALTRVDAAKLEMANDAMTRAQGAARGVFNTIAVELAPIISTLANRFADAAKENNGFRDAVLDGFEKVTTAIAYSANVLRGLHVVWLGLKTIAANAIAFILEGLVALDKGYTDVFNKVADSSIGKAMGIQAAEYSTVLNEAATSVRNVANDVERELHALAMQELPAEGIKAWFAEVRATVHKAAEEIAAARAKGLGGGVTPGGGTDPEFQALLDNAAKRFGKLVEMTSSERELMQAAHAQRLADLDNAFVLELTSEEEYRRIREELELQHQAKLGDIHAQGVLARRQFEELNWQSQTAMVFGEMEAITRGVANHSKALFRINQVAGIANAIISAHEGAARTLAKYPWPLGPALAALHYAAGIARVQAIRSASFGGSTSAPSVGGGGATPVTPAEPVTPAPIVTTGGATSQPQFTIIINGVVSTSELIDAEIIPGLRDAVDTRDALIISPNSRQARELLPA